MFQIPEEFVWMNIDQFIDINIITVVNQKKNCKEDNEQSLDKKSKTMALTLHSGENPGIQKQKKKRRKEVERQLGRD